MTTTRYRKKPIPVQAQQLTAATLGEISRSLTRDQFMAAGEDTDGTVFLAIRTLEGVMKAREGDWIIKGVRGEPYPVRADIFAETYEPVAAPSAPVDRAASGSGREAEAELYVLLRKAGEDRYEAQALIDRHRAEVLRRMADEEQPAETQRRHCPACGHFICDGNGPCGAITHVSAVSDEERCTCTGPAEPRCTCGDTTCESELCDCDSTPCPVGHADEEQPDETEAPPVCDVQLMLTRMRANASTHDLDYLLRLIARWVASSEGRDVLLDDLVAGGYRLPHACGNCEGVDPDICLKSPDRAAVAQPGNQTDRRRRAPTAPAHPVLRLLEHLQQHPRPRLHPNGQPMTEPSSTPRAEHTPAPGTTWQTTVVRTEQIVHDTDTAGPDKNQPLPPPPNRATRRAMQRAARRNTK